MYDTHTNTPTAVMFHVLYKYQQCIVCIAATPPNVSHRAPLAMNAQYDSDQARVERVARLFNI